MEIKGSNIYVEASELPNLTQIIPSDKILVQPSNSPSLIAFEDFILDSNNTTFYGIIENNTATVPILSTNIQSISSTITNYATTTAYNTSTDTITLCANNVLEYTAVQIAATSDNLYNEYLTTITSVSSFDRAAKEWVIIDSNGSIIDSTSNIQSVTDNGGYQVITFKNPLPTTKYCVIASSEDSIFSSVKVRSRSVNSVEIIVTRDTALLTTFDTVSLMIFYT
jgi:hypothetical protein